MATPIPVRLSSSLRSVSPEVTLARAKKRAASLGITRVTDITRLDRVGIPVSASIRPGAVVGSLCVSAGKGLFPIEAQIGAYMEAIELALAEPGVAKVTIVKATARDVLDGRERPEAILDFCPKLEAKVSLDAPMDCVAAEDIVTGESLLVPAELVFLPFRPHPKFGGLFGTSSNGLASGNTLREATVHAIAELIERDIRSFEGVRDTSALVDLDTVEGPAKALVTTIRDAGLELYVRYAPNVFGVPYFSAVINDPEALAPHLLNGGFGCHPHRSVAFVRAVSEAAQSRLSYIHGGRDDLIGPHERFASWNEEKTRAHIAKVVGRASDATKRIAMHDIPDLTPLTSTLEECENVLLQSLRDNGMPRVLRIVLSDRQDGMPKDDLHVVRVIVPRLELFGDSIVRVGPRLRDHARPT